MNTYIVKLLALTLFSSPFFSGFSKKINQQDSMMIKQLFNTSLNDGQSYQWLDYLSNNIGSRLSGSLGAELAVDYTKEQMIDLDLDNVWFKNKAICIPLVKSCHFETNYLKTNVEINEIETSSMVVT